jgi:type I restriction enzyme M protein
MSTVNNFQEKVTFIWDLADLLRGSYKRNEYQKVILPFTILKRFDSSLEYSKKDIIEQYNEFKDQFDNLEHLYGFAKDKNGNKLGFFNYSDYDFKSLLQDPEHIEENLMHYLDCFSHNVQDIFNNFQIKNHINRLSKNNLLFLLIQKFQESQVDLHPDKVSNHEMGTIFEELIRKFAEQSNEEAGEHFTPRDVVELMTKIMFSENKETLKKKKDLIILIYDPACGTGGMLTSTKEYIKANNDSIEVVLYGQEINQEIYAICKADMLIKGENAENIKGPSSTLSQDQLPDEKFHYMISNPPYGRKWEQDKEAVLKEAEKGFKSRFGAGTPRINDGQLLFIQHMLSKMKKDEKSRIAVITNGSPLFTGDANSGESNIRKYIIENNYLETIIALPEQLFYNTGIKTYIWILTNQKTQKEKIQLINASDKSQKMRKSLGNKRNYLSTENINQILDLYSKFEENKNSKIFDNENFGYTKVVIERPLQLNYQINKERLNNLYTIPAFAKLSESKKRDPATKLKEEEAGKQKQDAIIKALKKIDKKLYTNYDTFEIPVKKALDKFNFSPSLIKNIIMALSEHDDKADIVTDNRGKRKPDPKLKDTEKIPLKKDIDKYFKEEVLKYYPHAWMDREKDKIGYEINFTQHFYKYQPPRPLEEIEADIKKITTEIQELIKEDLNET